MKAKLSLTFDIPSPDMKIPSVHGNFYISCLLKLLYLDSPVGFLNLQNGLESRYFIYFHGRRFLSVRVINLALEENNK